MVKINGVGYYADVVNGKAKIILPELPAGKYKLKVKYEGDDKYLPWEDTYVEFTVSKVKASISVSGDDIEVGDDATVTVHLPEDATGTVTITVEGKKYTVAVKDGAAVFSIPDLSEGVYTVTVYYSGDDKYDPSETTTTITVEGDHHKNKTDGKNHTSIKSEGILLSNYPTANPIWILLLLLVATVSTQLRRFKK